MRLTIIASLLTAALADFHYPAFLPSSRRVAHSRNRTIKATYAKNYFHDTELRTFLDDYTTKTWSGGSSSGTDKYGQSAWNALWSKIGPRLIEPSFVPTTPEISIAERTYPAVYPRLTEGHGAKLGKDFIWGLASSAQQIEGAIQADGSGPSALDNLFHQYLVNQDTSDVSALSYYKYEEDIARLAAIGVPYYSFSIKWARVVPFGVAGSPINYKAVEHYAKVIEKCRQYGIHPIVTLTHWDTPFAIMNGPLDNLTYGAFNAAYDRPDFVDNYLYYAKYIVGKFGDIVGSWVTFNEVQAVSANVIGARHVVIAHAKLYHWYHHVVKGKAKFTFKQTQSFALPLNASSPDDILAANRQNEIQLGLFSNPVYLGRNLPESITRTVQSVPLFSADELKYIHNTADYFAIDTYSVVLVTQPPNGISGCSANKSDPLWPVCVKASSIDPVTGFLLNGVGQPTTAIGNAGPLSMTPGSLRVWLRYIQHTYNPKGGIIITEIGRASNHALNTPLASYLTDTDQATWLLSMYEAILQSKVVDKVDLRGVITWAALDNWEFGDYVQKFGLQYVDFTGPEKKRYYKSSIFTFLDFFTRFT